MVPEFLCGMATSCSSLLVLDGGLGHLLKAKGVCISGLPYDQQFLAGVLANEADPDTVKAAHAEYIAAGCKCITTNNFVATNYSLKKVKRQSDATRLIQLAGKLAREAVIKSQQQDVKVAGCLPPLQESYQSESLPDQECLLEEYRQIALTLSPYVDVFLAETLSTAAEAQAALTATADLAKPTWVSFSLEDSSSCCLRSKEPLEAAVRSISHHKHLAAVLANCCAPGAITAAIPVLKQTVVSGILVGCYANGFQTTTTQWMTGADAGLLEINPDDYDTEGLITPAGYLKHARLWQAAGAEIIGGCCGVGPQHMKLLAACLQEKAA